MQNKSRAFTLIELLVVVLIIGILAAVAVPQYQLAVAKSRIGGLLALGKSVMQAQEVYYLANGGYTQDWDKLSIGTPGEKLTGYPNIMRFSDGDIGLATLDVAVTPKKVSGLQLVFFFEHTSYAFHGKTACYAKMSNDFANKVCQVLTGKKTRDSNNGPDTENIYLF